MENTIWHTLYNRAKAVQNDRTISPFMEAGAVGAAVLTAEGNIYTGVCIDTASGMGMCAERNAMANMLTNGEDKISKVVAVMPDGSSGTPCGICREFMMQLNQDSRNIEILLSLDPLKTVRLGDMMPDWWGEKYLQAECCTIKELAEDLAGEMVYDIYKLCMYKPTFEKYLARISNRKQHKNFTVYGCYLHNELIGIAGICPYFQEVEITDIAVKKDMQKKGVGRKIIEYLTENYQLPLLAETDDDAVGFYRKCGFKITEVTTEKNNELCRRYLCRRSNK